MIKRIEFFPAHEPELSADVAIKTSRIFLYADVVCGYCEAYQAFQNNCKNCGEPLNE